MTTTIDSTGLYRVVKLQDSEGRTSYRVDLRHGNGPWCYLTIRDTRSGAEQVVAEEKARNLDMYGSEHGPSLV